MPGPTDPEEGGRRKNLLFTKKRGKERQQDIKCFFNETNPKDVQSGSSCAVHKHGGNGQTNKTTALKTAVLAQDQAGLAAGGVSPGRHRGRRHRAGHGRGGHRLLLALPQAGLQVYVHVFYGDRRKGRLTTIPGESEGSRSVGCFLGRFKTYLATGRSKPPPQPRPHHPECTAVCVPRPCSVYVLSSITQTSKT